MVFVHSRTDEAWRKHKKSCRRSGQLLDARPAGACLAVSFFLLVSGGASFLKLSEPFHARSRERHQLRDAVIMQALDYGIPGGRYAPPADLKPPLFGVDRSPSGLVWQVLEKGDGGDKPDKTDTVKVTYIGWKASNGQMFDSSFLRTETAKFKLSEVIPGWTEGVAMMTPGEKRRFWIPGKLAYGEEGSAAEEGGPPLGDLIFDIELLEAVPPGIDPFVIFFCVGGAFLLILSLVYSFVAVEPERREYDVTPLFSISPSKYG